MALNEDLLSSILYHLEWLVAAQTENPPRLVRESGIIERLGVELGADFTLDVTDLGGGSICLLACRGAPDVLFNFHLDTVPAAQNWDGSPFRLAVQAERAVGLGACDIKGAAAAMLAAAKTTAGDLALLFSTDEEGGDGRCIKDFLRQTRRFKGVVVAEPTEGRAVLAHRGIVTASGRFRGRAGHASQSDALENSASHDAVQWAAACIDYARGSETPRGPEEPTGDPLQSLRFNLGRIEGGEKPNIVAAETRVRFGIRTPPGRDPRAVLAGFQALARRPDRVDWELGFVGPPLPTDVGGLSDGKPLATRLGLPIGPPVDFWTEAALFSADGYPAIVFGPGDIAQAHTRNEWVALAELTNVARIYQRILATQRG